MPNAKAVQIMEGGCHIVEPLHLETKVVGE